MKLNIAKDWTLLATVLFYIGLLFGLIHLLLQLMVFTLLAPDYAEANIVIRPIYLAISAYTWDFSTLPLISSLR